jgi:hypothetical protein
MPRLDRTKRIDPAQADNYAEVARRIGAGGTAVVYLARDVKQAAEMRARRGAGR